MVEHNLGKLNVLIVDDNKHVRALVKSILRALGVSNVKATNDGEEALKELQRFPPDLVICD